jgi:O-antigen/teichoic acid export membrane protein
MNDAAQRTTHFRTRVLNREENRFLLFGKLHILARPSQRNKQKPKSTIVAILNHSETCSRRKSRFAVELTKIAEESARGSFSLIAGNAASTIISAAVVIIIARLLGPSGYGVYTLALVLPTLFAGVADLGMSPALNRYAANLRSERKYSKLADMIRSGFIFEFAAGAVVSVVAFAFSRQLAAFALQREDIGQLVALASFMIIFQVFFSYSYSAFVGLDRMGLSAIMLVLRDATRTVMSPLLIIVGFGVGGAIGGQITGWVFASMLGAALLLRSRRTLRNRPGVEDDEKGLSADIQTMMRYGVPLYVGALITLLYIQYQNIVLAFFSSNAEIGNYRAAVNFGALIAILATPVATALFPAFSKLDLQTKKEELQRMFDYSVKYTTLLIVPVAIMVAALSRDLVRALFGSAYSSAALYLAMYVAVFLLTAIGSQVISSFLNGVGKTRETLKIALVQLGVFLPAAPIATWLYGVLGLIVALLLSSLISTIFGLRIATRKYMMHVHLKDTAAALGAAVVSAGPILPLIYYSRLSALANVFIGAFIYLAAYLTLAPVFRAIKRVDVEILAPIIGQIKILRPATDLIFTYEGRLLDMLERDTNLSEKETGQRGEEGEAW